MDLHRVVRQPLTDCRSFAPVSAGFDSRLSGASRLAESYSGPHLAHARPCRCLAASVSCSSDTTEGKTNRACTPLKSTSQRVMLKISGEALQGRGAHGVDNEVLQTIACEVATVVRTGMQVAIVVGGGNYFRGSQAPPMMERATADYVGMLATCMNAIMLQSVLERLGVPTRVQTAIEMREVAEPYIRRRAIRHLERGRVVIFAAGTGAPFFTTDTAAALRAAEIGADTFYKGTKVDGVYDRDPAKFLNAKLHKRLSYERILTDNIKVMDQTAITMCSENRIKVVVFNMVTPGNIVRALSGEDIGTVVQSPSEKVPHNDRTASEEAPVSRVACPA